MPRRRRGLRYSTIASFATCWLLAAAMPAPRVDETIRGGDASARHAEMAAAYAKKAEIASRKALVYRFRANRYIEPGRIRKLEFRRRCLAKAAAYDAAAREARALAATYRLLGEEAKRKTGE